MGNLSNTPKLITCRIDKGNITHKSLYPIFASDSDFNRNSEEYQYDTLAKGFCDEAERQSTEIWIKRKNIEDEKERLDLMLADVFEVKGFIGTSSEYGDWVHEVIETEFEFIVIISTVI